MHVVSVSGLAKSYDERVLFEDVSFGITTNDRIALVGANGSGKSTLLKIIAGLVEPDAGEVVLNNDARVRFLAQDPDLPDATALDAVVATDPVVQPHEAEAMLARLGVPLDLRLTTASGGQRRRVALAQALLAPCDLLILDEPTNHLDVDSVDWLEDQLRRRRGGLLLVSHDRYLLDRLTTTILEIDLAAPGRSGATYWHEGGYSAVLEHRLARTQAFARQEARRRNLAAKELAWLRRGPKARTSKPKFRMEQAHALQDGPQTPDTMPLDLGTGRKRLGQKVIEVEELTFRYGEEHPFLVAGMHASIGPGDRIGIVGPNGAGKTTLLRLLTGELAPTSGLVDHGPTVELGIYRQQHERVDDGRRVLDTILDVGTHIPLANGERLTAEKLAERFGFDTRLLRRFVGDLSGGERRRLALLRLLIEAPNVLVFDEPTNDLDIDTLAALEDHLDGFSGTLVVASHDRFLLDRLTDQILAVEPGGAVRTYQDWESYRDAVAGRAEAAATRRPTPRPRASAEENRARQARRKRLRQLDNAVDRLTKRVATLESGIADAGADYETAATLVEELAAVREDLEKAELEWLELSEQDEG